MGQKGPLCPTRTVLTANCSAGVYNTLNTLKQRRVRKLWDVISLQQYQHIKYRHASHFSVDIMTEESSREGPEGCFLPRKGNAKVNHLLIFFLILNILNNLLVLVAYKKLFLHVKEKHRQKYKVLLWQLTMWMLRINTKENKTKEDCSFGINKKWKKVDRQI